MEAINRFISSDIKSKMVNFAWFGFAVAQIYPFGSNKGPHAYDHEVQEILHSITIDFSRSMSPKKRVQHSQSIGNLSESGEFPSRAHCVTFVPVMFNSKLVKLRKWVILIYRASLQDMNYFVFRLV